MAGDRSLAVWVGNVGRLLWTGARRQSVAQQSLALLERGDGIVTQTQRKARWNAPGAA